MARSDAVRELAPGAIVIEAGSNLGFAAACNLGARDASTPLLVFLNPDAIPLEGFRDAIELPLADGRGWAAWQGLVTAEGGSVDQHARRRHPLHGDRLGGWAGEPLDAEGADGPDLGGRSRNGDGEAPRARRSSRASSPAPAWRFRAPSSIGSAGSPRTTSSTTRTSTSRCGLRLEGGRLGVAEAPGRSRLRLCEGPVKWRRLERNRWATIIRTYPTTLLALVLPGRCWHGAGADPDLDRRRLVRLEAGRVVRPGALGAARWRGERRRIQATRTIGPASSPPP